MTATSGEARQVSAGYPPLSLMSNERSQGSGKSVPVPYLVFGAHTRSMVALQPEPVMGLVESQTEGKWNHGAPYKLTLLIDPDIAEEWGRDLIDCAAAARRDEQAYKRRHGS